MTDQNRRLVIRVARNFLVVFLLKYHSLDEILGWGPFFFGNGSANVVSERGGVKSPDPRSR